MPLHKGAPDRAKMYPGAGTLVRDNNTVLDATATLEAILARLVQIQTNTGGDDPVNLETIMQAVQAACEVSAADLDATVATLIAIRDAALDIRNSSAASAADLAALELINTAIQAAVETIDNTVGTHGVAAPTQVLMQGQYAEGTVPPAVTDGQVVRPWYDLCGRLVQLATNLAQASLDVSDVAPAQMQIQKETGWTALSAPAAETPAINVQDYENHTVEYIIETIDTSVDLIIWGSIDGGTTWFKLSEFTVLAADDQTDSVVFTGVKVEQIKCEFDAEVGGTAAVVTFKIMSGN